ncbi:MAG: type 4a pilus biogenesis protein PilO [Bdellovibrio sp.]|nr:type 4a pilus biogenesis protein PilO [Bdellovibrio sp.]
MKFVKMISQFSMFRMLILAAVMATAYFFMYYDSGETLETQITQLKAEVSQEQVKKKDTEATIKKEDEMQANVASIARDLQVVKAKIPNEFKDTEMTTIINKASVRSGVSVLSLARKKDAQIRSNLPGSESVEEISFDLTINGSFNRLVQFVEILAREEKIIKLRDFTIERNSTNPNDSSVKFKGDVIGFKQAQEALKPPDAQVKK